MLNGKIGKKKIKEGAVLNGIARTLRPQMLQKTSPRNGQEFGFGIYSTQNLDATIMDMI